MNQTEAELAPGAVGPLLDTVPLLTHSMVRPYVIAIALHRGAVRDSELYAALVPHCSTSDLQVGAWSALEGDYLDCSRLELIVSEVLGEYVAAGVLRYNGTSDIWVANESSLMYWISKTTELNAQLPKHLLRVPGAQQRAPAPF